MKRLTMDEYERLVGHRGVRVSEGSETQDGRGNSLTPVRIERRGFRPLEAVVVVPLPEGWDRVEA